MKKIILFIILILTITSGCSKPNKVYSEKTAVTIHAGDTLWSIASRYNGDTYILKYLETLKSLPENKEVLQPNRLLKPGDKIVVLRVKGAGE